MESVDFMNEVLSYMGSLGLSDLENSGLRFPAENWDWQDCCHACVWIGFMGHELPGNLMSRLLLGPPSPLVALYLKWLRHKSGGDFPGNLFDLAG